MLWFSDTVADLNGVSVTMTEVAACARRLNRPLRLVGCLTPEEQARPQPPDLINLPCIYTVKPDFYSAHTVRVPSLLGAIDQIAAHNPDRIVISTPGPVGLVGLAAARLLGVLRAGGHLRFSKHERHIRHGRVGGAGFRTTDGRRGCRRTTRDRDSWPHRLRPVV